MDSFVNSRMMASALGVTYGSFRTFIGICDHGMVRQRLPNDGAAYFKLTEAEGFLRRFTSITDSQICSLRSMAVVNV